MSMDEKGVIVSCEKCGQRNRIPYTGLTAQIRCGQCQTQLSLPRTPISVPTASSFTAMTDNASIPVFVDFWAPWCGPCKMVALEIEKVAAAAGNRFLVTKLNTEEVPVIAQRFQINSIPTMAVFHKGRELGRTAGARPAPAILAFIQQTIASS